MIIFLLSGQVVLKEAFSPADLDLLDVAHIMLVPLLLQICAAKFLSFCLTQSTDEHEDSIESGQRARDADEI